jgi:DNA topoisomerase-1
VWICPVSNGHLQATGRDARGRKQYRYHPRWHAVRDETKYERLLRFARTLPRIRERVQQDLDQPGLARTKLLAMVVRLLETTFIRIGNEEYARSNGSFGLTTLQGRHVQVDGTRIRFQFRGKSGKVRRVAITDRRLAELVRRCRELPGKELFQYLDESGEPQSIDSADVNEYLRSISGEDFTAKDFRTWAGTVLAARWLMGAGGGRPRGPSAVVAAARAVAEQLGNTPAVCRKAYIHPLLLACHQDPTVLERWKASARGRVRAGLSRVESRLIRFLATFPAG